MIFPLFRSAFEVNKRSFEQVQQERDLNHGSLPSELVDLLICMGHKPVLKPGDIARSITSDITMGEGRCRLAHFLGVDKGFNFTVETTVSGGTCNDAKSHHG